MSTVRVHDDDVDSAAAAERRQVVDAAGAKVGGLRRRDQRSDCFNGEPRLLETSISGASSFVRKEGDRINWF